MHERARNAPMAMDLAAADAALCPTEFQAAQFPPIFRRALAVLHDGVDTGYYRPEPAAVDRTLGGRVAEDARVVTYATRGMEPHRGFPQFMAALPAILADPKAVAVVAGDNRVAYGGDALRRIDWKAEALARHDIDPARVRFVGHLDRPSYRRAAAPVRRPRLPDRALRPVLVDARGHELRLQPRPFRHRTNPRVRRPWLRALGGDGRQPRHHCGGSGSLL